jgi:hypothetical protein
MKKSLKKVDPMRLLLGMRYAITHDDMSATFIETFRLYVLPRSDVSNMSDSYFVAELGTRICLLQTNLTYYSDMMP